MSKEAEKKINMSLDRAVQFFFLASSIVPSKNYNHQLSTNMKFNLSSQREY